MSTSMEVPVPVVERARKHVAKTGTPLLLRDRRRRSDWPLMAISSQLGYLLLLHPETAPAQMYFAMAERNPERDVLADIAKLAVRALEDLPRQFMCDGKVVGLWEILPSEAGPSVCVRGPVALTLLSWALRARKVGCYLTLSEVPTGDDD